MNKLIITIERPDGSLYEQEIEYIDEDIEKSVQAARSYLGSGYLIVSVRKEKIYE